MHLDTVRPDLEVVELRLLSKDCDPVFEVGELDVRAVLRRLRPHLHVKGTDYTPETVPELLASLG